MILCLIFVLKVHIAYIFLTIDHGCRMSEASMVHTQFIQLKMVKIRVKIRTRFNALLC